jgi:DNA-binding response OmpR family regulator
MLPHNLALVDDDSEFTEYLAQHLREQGVGVTEYRSADDLLADRRAFAFDFYVLDLGLPGIDGLDLVRLLRRRSDAGMLVVSGRVEADVFESVVNAGADMYLAKPVRFDQVQLAVRAIHRRISMALRQASNWRLDREARALIAPDGARVELSDGDLAILGCFVGRDGETVSRDTLRQALGYAEGEESDNTLTATVYRLRRRIERATTMVVPLQSQSRMGYVFKATLLAA